MSDTFWAFLGVLLCIGVVCLVLIGAGVLLYVNRTRSRKKVAVRANWRPVPGRVTNSGVEEAVRTRADDDAFWCPYVEYAYTVEGQAYAGKQAVGRPVNAEFMAKRTLRQYPPGTEVAVVYNPARPDESQLALR